MTLRNISIDLQLGQEILVGKNRDRAKITKIEFHERSGEININTTLGPRRVLTFALTDSNDDGVINTADKYR